MRSLSRSCPNLVREISKLHTFGTAKKGALKAPLFDGVLSRSSISDPSRKTLQIQDRPQRRIPRYPHLRALLPH